MLTSRPTPVCLCKPFSSQGCPGNFLGEQSGVPSDLRRQHGGFQIVDKALTKRWPCYAVGFPIDLSNPKTEISHVRGWAGWDGHGGIWSGGACRGQGEARLGGAKLNRGGKVRPGHDLPFVDLQNTEGSRPCCFSLIYLAWKGFPKTNRRRYAGQQPETKSAFRPAGKPDISFLYRFT